MTTGAFVSAAVDSVLRQEVGSQSFLSRKQQKIKFSATRYPRRTAQAASGNHESVVIFRGAGELTASFTAHFERMWSLFAPAAAAASG